jgi:hypothetical protein
MRTKLLYVIIFSLFFQWIYSQENKEDFFYIYKRVINRIVVMINNVNPDYPYAKSLVSTLVEGALHQHFLQDHLKTITNCNETITPTDFYLNLVENTIRK